MLPTGQLGDYFSLFGSHRLEQTEEVQALLDFDKQRKETYEREQFMNKRFFYTTKCPCIIQPYLEPGYRSGRMTIKRTNTVVTLVAGRLV